MHYGSTYLREWLLLSFLLRGPLLLLLLLVSRGDRDRLWLRLLSLLLFFLVWWLRDWSESLSVYSSYASRIHLLSEQLVQTLRFPSHVYVQQYHSYYQCQSQYYLTRLSLETFKAKLTDTWFSWLGSTHPSPVRETDLLNVSSDSWTKHSDISELFCDDLESSPMSIWLQEGVLHPISVSKLLFQSLWGSGTTGPAPAETVKNY